MKYKITIAYDGRNYHGWQIQNNASTIQEYIILASQKLFKEEVIVTGASRTDAGVHALGQVATIEGITTVPVKQLPRAFNAHLPDNIVVHNAEVVDESFHPRYCALKKTYTYAIYNGPYKIPQYAQYAWFFQKPLDVQKMKLAAKHFEGEHDFVGFSSTGSSVQSTIRTIEEVLIKQKDHFIEIKITGNGFLYNMVRIITGTLVDVGLGKIGVQDIPSIIESRDRNLAGKTAPANGLTLVEIMY